MAVYPSGDHPDPEFLLAIQHMAAFHMMGDREEVKRCLFACLDLAGGDVQRLISRVKSLPGLQAQEKACFEAVRRSCSLERIARLAQVLHAVPSIQRIAQVLRHAPPLPDLGKET